MHILLVVLLREITLALGGTVDREDSRQQIDLAICLEFLHCSLTTSLCSAPFRPSFRFSNLRFVPQINGIATVLIAMALFYHWRWEQAADKAVCPQAFLQFRLIDFHGYHRIRPLCVKQISRDSWSVLRFFFGNCHVLVQPKLDKQGPPLLARGNRHLIRLDQPLLLLLEPPQLGMVILL